MTFRPLRAGYTDLRFWRDSGIVPRVVSVLRFTPASSQAVINLPTAC